jgi:hypothetical protein
LQELPQLLGFLLDGHAGHIPLLQVTELGGVHSSLGHIIGLSVSLHLHGGELSVPSQSSSLPSHESRGAGATAPTQAANVPSA